MPEVRESKTDERSSKQKNRTETKEQNIADGIPYEKLLWRQLIIGLREEWENAEEWRLKNSEAGKHDWIPRHYLTLLPNAMFFVGNFLGSAYRAQSDFLGKGVWQGVAMDSVKYR
jgi:hypothetical protein